MNLLAIDVFSEQDITVLIEGETGVGKELVARMLHSLSSRCRERFVHVDVSAINLSLFDAELFGYRYGAFTSAVRDHEGYFMSAGHGTIFLDETGKTASRSEVPVGSKNSTAGAGGENGGR